VNPLFAAAAEIQHFCRAHGWKFCVIGGLAVQRWGDPRFTRDVDFTVLTGFGQESAYVDILLAQFTGRVANAREFALINRVLLITTGSGVPVDVSLGALPFEERLIQRASPFSLGQGESVRTCSAEDLIVLKAFAGRDRDWADIEGILMRQTGQLDQRLVFEELTPLLELKDETTDASSKLKRLFDSGAK
jgi:predicted nucleotidyltransferase